MKLINILKQVLGIYQIHRFLNDDSSHIVSDAGKAILRKQIEDNE